MKILATAGLLYIAGTAFGQQADTALMVNLPTVNVVDGTRNDTLRYRYNQTRYYITTILPYLNAAMAMINELNEKEKDPAISKRERKAFVNAKEDELQNRFKQEIRQLNETQGVLLIKLIARQSGANIYDKLDEYKSTLYAIKWQAWARLHGFNLNRRYNPQDEPMLEHIMENLGYPLPAGYMASTQ